MDTAPTDAHGLSLDLLSLGVRDRDAARSFYDRVLAAGSTPSAAEFDTHGTGRFALHPLGDTPMPAHASTFPGAVLTYVVGQPTEVEMVMEAAIEAGAAVLRPARKMVFGAFSGVFRAPDGAIWKVVTTTNKVTRPAEQPPRPAETTIILGVDDPKISQDFYQALGMIVDPDQSGKSIDFRPQPGASRFCLMQRDALAKDAGMGKAERGSPSIICVHRTMSREQVDRLLAAAASAGGTVTDPAREDAAGHYAGRFADPDGTVWRVTHG